MMAGRTIVVLLVDDQTIVAEAIRRMLGDQADIELHHCADVALALPMARGVRPAVILQDLVMPGANGFDLVRMFRGEPETSNIPIMVLSSREDPRDKSRAFELGASDYLVKIPDKVELVARVRAHARSFIAQLERDEAYRALDAARAQLEATNRELQRLTTVDALTQLANRRYLDETLDLEWRRCRRESTPLSLILGDVDHFKNYNDAYGHLAGDDCLRQVALALQSAVRASGALVARYGGEELAVVLPRTAGTNALAVAQELRARVEELAIPHIASPYGIVTLSLGVACCSPESDETIADLVGATDQALYQAKHDGRNRCALAGEPGVATRRARRGA
jgi:two-component system chemotaxis family response regulator WspR